ncbi:MAG: thrombospondin type 3 repeat-containing protein [Puniceicoccaceae bacterium]
MKHSFPIHLISLVALLTQAVFASQVQETPEEFHLVGDLDGDGREDLVVIDKASGGFRAAYQLSEGNWTWYPARATGMDNITGVAMGHWFGTDKDSFAVTSPLANRVHVIQANVPGGLPQIDAVFPEGIGPAELAAPDIGGFGNTIHDDLWIGSRENGAPDPNHITTVRHDGLAFSDLDDSLADREIQQARDVIIKEGGERVVVYLGKAGGQDDDLTLLAYDTGTAEKVATAAVPEDSLWASGLLVSGTLHHFVTWRIGQPVIDIHEVTEAQVDVFGLSSIGSFDTGNGILSLSIVQSDNGARIVAIDASGESARVYSFDGINAPQLLQTIDSPEGSFFTGALPLGSGGFQMLDNNGATSGTTGTTIYNPDGGTFLAGGSAELPKLRRAAVRANAFAFASEPFVDPEAQMLALYNVPDWTSDPVLQGNQLSLQSEVLEGPEAGLGSPMPVVVGTVPVGTAFALTNQYNGAISLHSYSASRGASGASVDISPVDGIKTKAFLMSFAPQPANAPVYYRRNDGAWVLWNSTPVLVGETTTVHFYAVDPNTQRPSAIRVVDYIFEEDAFTLDSDKDSVPDFVELAEGLDPLGGVDTDGDGYGDLNELLVGTDPALATETPSPEQRLEENIAFQLRVAPLPVDGLSGNRATAAEGARLDVFALDGSNLAGDAAAQLGQQGVTGPGLGLDAVIADTRQGLVSVMTEPVYAVTTPEEDKDRGREIAALYAIPEGTIPEIEYTPGNGTLQEEAAAWIAAALAARNSIVRPTISGNWTEIDTLSGLLLEVKLESIFLARSLPDLEAGKLTLFGGRTGDAGRFTPTGDDFADLRIELSESLPGYDIRELFTTIDDAVQSDQGLANLRDVATAIYAVSSENSNAAPPGTYLPPFEVLRSFVRGNALPEPYLSELGINPGNIDAAQASIAPLLNGLPSRPVESFTLEVQPDSFDGGCHALFLLGTNQPVNLFAAPGQPYASTDGFDLIDGTRLFVTGYTDVVDDDCDGTDMEVISVVVLSFPLPADADTNQNLLIDAWEDAFLMGDGDPYGDADGDGINNLQEMLDGTDPLDPMSMGMNAIDLSPPEIMVLIDQEGITLTWDFPADYAQLFDWLVTVSDDFLNWSPVANPVVESPAGSFTVEIPASEAGIFQVQMLLK